MPCGAASRFCILSLNHANIVRAAVFGKDGVTAAARPEKLLILGTSRKMVDRIATTLDLPAPCRYYSIGDVSTPGEIATAIAYLASDEAAYVTGQTLRVNGGMYM